MSKYCLFVADLEREQSLPTPCGSELRNSFSCSRTRSGHCNGSAAPLPSPRYCASSRSTQLEDLSGAGASGMQSQTCEYKMAYTRAGCGPFKSTDALPGCPLKTTARLPVTRSWAAHSAYGSEFAIEIEAQQTPRHRRTGSGFGISCAPAPVHAAPETPRNQSFQVWSNYTAA